MKVALEMADDTIGVKTDDGGATQDVTQASFARELMSVPFKAHYFVGAIHIDIGLEIEELVY